MRITLAADDFASLYRGLPPETSLLLILDRPD
jgi:hypothetical protein